METKTGSVSVLVVALDNLGDAVMASSVIPAIRRKHPKAKIGLWVKNYAADLFVGHSKINCLHACDPFWDRSPVHGKGSFQEFKKTLRDIRKERYRTAIIINSEWRRALAVWWAGVPERIGLNRRKSFLFLTRRAQAGNSTEHFVDQHRRLLEAWWKEKVLPQACIPDIEASPVKKPLWPGKCLIAVHPFSGDPRKNWPLDRWRDLLNRLMTKNKDYRFLVVCAASEKDALEALTRGLSSDHITVKAGAPLSEIKNLLSQSSLAIGGDSGPGHVAAAVGTPVITLFSFTDPRRSIAIGRTPVKIIQRNPLSELEVAVVEEAVQEFIDNQVLRK